MNGSVRALDKVMIQGHANNLSGENKYIFWRAFEKDILLGLFEETVEKESTFLFRYSYLSMNKISLQTNLKRNPTNSSYIFILSVNFENLTVRLHVLITSLMLTKFQENQK